MPPRFYAFWAINAPLDSTRLRRQIEEFRKCDFDGVVWHPRFYPGQPPYLGDQYLAEVSDVILYAKSLGLAFWLYDEDGWPSGTVGGQLLKEYPDEAQRWAELVTEKPEQCLAEFTQAGKKWFLAERTGQGVDYFNPDLARHFIELTHERYRTGLRPQAWEHVEAFFCDEPEFGLGHAYDSLSKHGAIPWTSQLPELFLQRHGEELLPLLPRLFFPGENGGAARVKFWELFTDLFNASFTTPINDWCQRQGKLFTAHVKGEEHPLFQVPTNGSCHQFFRHVSLPGIDALERYPANNFSPRQVSSAGRQFGNGRCMVEAFGGAGWGATPEDLERYLLWLGRNGLTDFVMHLSQYRLDSAAMHDWPPSQPFQLTWRDAYPEVLRRVRAELLRNSRPAADTLVISPIRGIMASYVPREFVETNVHNAATYPDTVAGRINRSFLERVGALHRDGVNYDLADERSVEQFARIESGQLKLGNCNYRHVIVDEGCKISSAALSLIQPLAAKAVALASQSITKIIMPAPSPVKVPATWNLEAHPVNCLLLECVPVADGRFIAEFSGFTSLLDSGLEIVFADGISGCVLNGNPLLAEPSNEGTRIKIGAMVVQGSNRLRFQTEHRVERPFVWLHGRFRVGSKTLFLPGPCGTIQTDGPFQIEPVREEIHRDLVADGFPFLNHSLAAVAMVDFPEAAGTLRLDGVVADTIRLTLDGRDCGWQWRVNGAICFAEEISAGTRRVKIELVPNTFNAYGPHHYYGGDWHVISPDQIKGRRNFADPADAPANTHVKAWHFRRFALPETLSFIPAG